MSGFLSGVFPFCLPFPYLELNFFAETGFGFLEEKEVDDLFEGEWQRGGVSGLSNLPDVFNGLGGARFYNAAMPILIGKGVRSSV